MYIFASIATLYNEKLHSLTVKNKYIDINFCS